MRERALVVASHGTLQEESQKRSIGKLEAEAAALYPDRRLYSIWTSPHVRGGFLKTMGIRIPSPGEILQQMHAEGITDVLILPAFAFQGKEYRTLLDLFAENQRAESPTRFEHVRVADPLLVSDEDLEEAVAFVARKYPKPESGSVITVCHSLLAEDDRIYERLQQCFDAKKLEYIRVGVLERPRGPGGTGPARTMGTGPAGLFSDKNGPEEPVPMGSVTLVPFLLTAGNHVLRDLSGDGEQSWKSVLKARGCEVTVVTQGLGENAEIREMFLRHLKDAGELI